MAAAPQPTLDQVIQWALEAGAIAREGFTRSHQVAFKGRTDLVTEIDFQIEQALIRAIHGAFPEHSILTEEAGALDGVPSLRWYVDPLDGTVNYAHQIPVYAVSIAFQDAEGLKLGVVYDPSRDECFSAQKGAGAWLNNEPLHVSAVDEVEKSLHATAFARQDEVKFNRNLRNFSYLSRHSLGVRRMGSAALELTYVACARLDAYWEQGINPWDIAAAALIVEEAGGVVTTPEGDPDYFKPPHAILAAAPNLHPRLLELFARLKDPETGSVARSPHV
ncbi:MAG: inositol monophosphatase family protein [Anaerolineaceae bacterium]